MKTVLLELRTHLQRSPSCPHPFRIFSIGLLSALIGFTGRSAILEWTYFFQAHPVQATLLRIGWRRDGGDWKHDLYIFDRCRFIAPSKRGDPLEYRLVGALNGRATEVERLRVGDAAIVWVADQGRRATPALRAPIGITASSLSLLTLLALCFWGRKTSTLRYLDRCLEAGTVVLPPRCREQTIYRADGSTKKLVWSPVNALLGILGVAAASMVAICATMGAYGAINGDEWIARHALAVALMFACFIIPMYAMLATVPMQCIRWSPEWISTGSFCILRKTIEHAAIVPDSGGASLLIYSQDRKSPRRVHLLAIWMAGVLENLGVPVEFSAGHP